MNNLPRGGGVNISNNLVRERAFIDVKRGVFVNNLKDKIPVAPLREESEVSSQDIQQAMAKGKE